MDISDRAVDLYHKVFDKYEESEDFIGGLFEDLENDGVFEESVGLSEENTIINNNKVFAPVKVNYAFLSRNDILSFISTFDERDFVNFVGNDITTESLLFVRPTVQTIIKNLKFNFDFKFYIGDFDKKVINDRGIVNEIPRYHPNIFINTKGDYLIDDNPILIEILSSKGIAFEVDPGIDKRNLLPHKRVEDADLPEEIFGIYIMKESNFEKMLINELSKNIGDIDKIASNLKTIMSKHDEHIIGNRINSYSIFIDEFIRTLHICSDEYGNIEDPILFMKTRLKYLNMVTMKNIIKYVKNNLVKNNRVDKDILSKSVYVIDQIEKEDILTKRDMFISDYHVITEHPEKYKHLKDNVYLIDAESEMIIMAFSDKFDYIYVPMAGVIHKIKTVKDNSTSVTITYRDHSDIMKRLVIPEKSMSKHNIYTTYAKAFKDGGQKESIEEREFLLKIEEMKRKYENIMLSKITSERKSKLDLITKMMKLIEMEKDQSAIIKMLEIEKQTLANQNSQLKNVKDGYDFAKRVATDALKYL